MCPFDRRDYFEHPIKAPGEREHGRFGVAQLVFLLKRSDIRSLGTQTFVNVPHHAHVFVEIVGGFLQLILARMRHNTANK